MPFSCEASIDHRSRLQTIFLLLLWAASLYKHSEKPSKWEAGFAISVEGCFPGHACAMAQPGDSMPKNSSCWCNVPAPPRLIRPSHSFVTAPNQAATWRCCQNLHTFKAQGIAQALLWVRWKLPLLIWDDLFHSGSSTVLTFNQRCKGSTVYPGCCWLHQQRE